MSDATRVVYFYDCNCDWISKYCDDHHQVSVRVPISYLRDPAEHDRQVAERAWDEGFSRGFYAGQAYPDGADASEPDIDNPYRKEQENNNA